MSYARYRSLDVRGDVFERLGAAREWQGSVVAGDDSWVAPVAAVTPELAALLQLSLDDGVVISDRLWRLQFRSAQVRGERMRVDGEDARIAAVAPSWLDGLFTGRAVDLWMPLREATLQPLDRTGRTFESFGWLKPGVSIARARRVLNASRPDTDDEVMVMPYTGAPPDLADGMSRVGTLVSAAAGAVFLIACANVGMFLLSRSSMRLREMSIRLALGARRLHLARQLLCDSIVVSIAGGACGALLAFWATRIIPALFFEQDAEHAVFTPDLRGIVAAASACAAVTFACGLMPLLEIRHASPAAILRRESSGPSRTMRRLSGGLVIVQMACSCLLLTSTAVLFEGFRGLLRTGAGNRLDQAVMATIEAGLGFARTDLGYQYFRNAERAAQSTPGVQLAAWVATPPGGERPRYPMRVEPPRLPLRSVEVNVALFGAGSLPLVRLPPISGRMFAGRDTAHACKVVIVNEEAAAELFHGDAVGRSLEGPDGGDVEVVGVVATRKPDPPARGGPTVFYSAEQTGLPLGRGGPSIVRVPILPEATHAALDAEVVSSNYFDALGAAAIGGQLFQGESAPDGCRIGVINQEAAELYFGGNAVGGAVIDGAGRRTQIIGVVPSRLLRTAQRREEPALYLPLEQTFRPRMTMILRTGGASDALLRSIRHHLDGVPGGAPGGTVVTTLDDQLSRTALAPERIATILLGASAAMAFALSVLGLYSAMGDAVRRRRRELALRLALGAPNWRVVRQLFVEGLQMAGAGVIAGLIGSLAMARWVTRLTLSSGGSGRIDLWGWLAALLVLLAAVAMASAIPVRRGLAVDPMTIMGEH
jgi:hypothetical protein